MSLGDWNLPLTQGSRLGEVVMLHEGAVSQERLSQTSHAGEHRVKKRTALGQWLQTGNVIYKSVGLGLMDLAVGMHLIHYAKEKGVGTQVEEF